MYKRGSNGLYTKTPVLCRIDKKKHGTVIFIIFHRIMHSGVEASETVTGRAQPTYWPTIQYICKLWGYALLWCSELKRETKWRKQDRVRRALHVLWWKGKGVMAVFCFHKLLCYEKKTDRMRNDRKQYWIFGGIQLPVPTATAYHTLQLLVNTST